MKSIPVITSAPIKYDIQGHDLYDSFDLVSRGAAVAPLKRSAEEDVRRKVFPFDFSEVQTIFCGSEGQTKDTAELFNVHRLEEQAEITPTVLLDGVRFSMTNLVPKVQFLSVSYEVAIRRAREQFVRQLFSNRLQEPLADVRDRIEQLRASLLQEERGALCISHSFFMRLIEITMHAPDLWEDVDACVAAFQPGQKPYESLEGFIWEIKK